MTGAPDAPPSLESWVKDLAESHDVRGSLVCRDSCHGRGLFAGTAVTRGDVVLSVPKRLVLYIQSSAGLSLPPDGSWPRVRAGVAADAPAAGKTWELILARAVVDAVAGDGGEFWAAYSGLMPPPETLAHPFLLDDEVMDELQDEALAEEGRREAARVAALLPDLADPLEPGGPSVGAWALALVRSRAMLAGSGGTYAVVPFLDLANHATAPTIDYRCDGVETRESSGIKAQAVEDADRFELVGLADVAPGKEVHLAYTKGNLTSAEHFAQYGFAPAGGSPMDRIDLRTDGGDAKAATRLKAAVRGLLKEALVTRGGSAPDWVAAAASVSAALCGPDSKAGDMMTLEEEVGLLDALRARVKDLEASWRTSLEEDEAALAAIEGARGSGEGDDDGNRERMGNILGLRLNKKRLARRIGEVLEGCRLQVYS